MNDDSRAVAENYHYDVDGPVVPETVPVVAVVPPSIPEYLQDTYWWAYLHPKSFWFFEREWVVNLILWGNMKRLLAAFMPPEIRPEHISSQFYFGGLYQKVVLDL